MTQDTYDRAVEIFDALLSGPTRGHHATPARLIQAAELPASTGYRHVATLEAEGLLRRDDTGVYLSGLAAMRTGLRAFAAGRVAPVAQPVVVQLRQATQHSAFLAVSQNMELWVGPHSVGRETRATSIERHYSFDAVPAFTLGAASETGLRSIRDKTMRRASALLIPVEITADRVVHLGLMLRAPRGPSPALTRALEQAGSQIQSAIAGSL